MGFMLTIVCVYNNYDILKEWLLNSLEKIGNTDYELILIDNTNGRFRSAAKAFNSVINRVKGDYVMFVHQDVKIESPLSEFEKYLYRLPDLGVAGLAGKREDLPYVIGNVTHGEPPRPACRISVRKPIRVQTVDSLLFIIPTEVLKKIRFDEEVCDNWHLYCEDYCLMAQEKLGLRVYILPLKAYHKSTGTIVKKGSLTNPLSYLPFPKEYYRTLIKVLRKHRRFFKEIYTTCGNYPTRLPWLYIYRLAFLKVVRGAISKLI